MVTDYLAEHCPVYIPTEDTAVVPFKYYFRMDGTVPVRVVNPLTTDNPQELSWYELSARAGNDEFRMYVEGLQVNGIAFICSMLVRRMNTVFPEFTLDRNMGGIDWSYDFFDTKWSEVVGSCPALIETTFAGSDYLATNIQKLITEFVKCFTEVAGSEPFGSAEAASIVSGIISNCVKNTSKTKSYTDLGYTFDVRTLGGTERTADTYELAVKWSRVNYRQYLQVFEAVRDKLRHGGYADQASQIESVIDIFSTAARDMCRLASQVVRIIPIVATKFDCTLVEVPSTIVYEGVTYYRLLFRRQLIDNRKYGSAIAINRGNGYEIALTDMQALTNAVIKLDIQYFTQFMLNEGTTPPATSEVALTSIQRGHVLYTDVNFDGV